jgi:hypothetical protein
MVDLRVYAPYHAVLTVGVYGLSIIKVHGVGVVENDGEAHTCGRRIDGDESA